MSRVTRYQFAAFVLACVGLLISLFATAAAAQSDRSSELQHLVNDLGYQLQLVEQFDRGSSEKRLRQLAIALDRWNTSTRTHADFEAMQAWLQAAIRASMPGTSKPMPELPWFDQRLARVDRSAVLPSPAAEPEQAVEAIPTEVAKTPTPPDPADLPVPVENRATSQPQVATTQPTEAVEPIEAVEPAEQVATAWQRHPAATPIDLGNPFADDPPQATRSSSTTRVALRPVTVPARTASSKVDINVAELSARIRGYVHGLRGVEARLLASPEMTSDQLLLAVRELQALQDQREFVSLYLNALAAEGRARTPDLPSPGHAKAAVNQQLDRLRQAGKLESRAEETIASMLQQF